MNRAPIFVMVAMTVLSGCGNGEDACEAFNDHCATGIEPNRDKIDQLLGDSLMLVTALNPHIGYDNAAKVAKKAYQDNSTLREAAESLGLLTGKEFDKLVRPEEMTTPKA